jgi:hypothetical protein
MKKCITIIWDGLEAEGEILVHNGRVSALRLISGNGSCNGTSFIFNSKSECKIELEIEDAVLTKGACSAIVNIKTSKAPFSFFLRDVNSMYPIYFPEYSVIVTEYGDMRSYKEISRDIESRNTYSKLEEIENEAEETFDNASMYTRNLRCVTWLGLSRDIRNFEIGFRANHMPNERWDWVMPKHHNRYIVMPELGDNPIRYDYFLGRGLGCEEGIKRWLEKGILPVLNAKHTDEDIIYETKMFVTKEKSSLKKENIKGTHYLVADAYSSGSMLTKEQEALKNKIHDNELKKEEETVIYIKIDVKNTAKTPRYSWIRIPMPKAPVLPYTSKAKPEYDGLKGYGRFKEDKVYLVATLNGKPVPQQEMAILLNPEEKIEYIFKIPHYPISEIRARALSEQDYCYRLNECVEFWEEKFSDSAKISLPEKRINEMIKAGLLHLDLICYGNEPNGAVAPTVGRYSPIGSESSPIIQYFESVGKNDLARRTIMYFIEKQHDDGFMQNFGGYMLETGAVLWNVGEHYRYTRDIEWIKSIKISIIKACDYIIRWREKNKKEELRGNGYGMIEGKVADPEDPYHSYMLNGFAYLGLARSAEVLREIDIEESKRLENEARDLKSDIRMAIDKSIAESPLVPLGSGRWCPSISPWTENRGPLSLYVDEGTWFTHGAIIARDAICGSMYLLIQEIVDPNELYGDFIIRSFSELFYQRNVAFSQPYYSPHPYANLKRGEVKAFLKEFYSNVSSLADRETYTFWEHYHYASPHKTHEEGWFLMRSRWMLYMEDKDTLNIFPGVPRSWLEDGKSISIDGMQSYFGPLKINAKSYINTGKIKVNIEINAKPERLPKKLKIRIPHPEYRKAAHVTLGKYCIDTESIIIEEFSGSVQFEVAF